MRAFRAGTCHLCRKTYDQRSLVARWTGRLVHKGCKDKESRRIASEGRIEALPDHLEAIERWPSRRQALRPAEGHTRGIKKM